MMSFFLEKDLLTTKAMPDKFDLSSPVTGNKETIVTKIEYISFYRLMKMADESKGLQNARGPQPALGPARPTEPKPEPVYGRAGPGLGPKFRPVGPPLGAFNFF